MQKTNVDINRSVTNYYEVFGILILIACHIVLYYRLQFNFPKILEWGKKNDCRPGMLLCVNSNLLLISLLKILTFTYALMAGLSDMQTQQQIYFNTYLYQGMSNYIIVLFNMTIKIVANQWLSGLKYRYQEKETLIVKILKFETISNIIVSLICFLVITISQGVGQDNNKTLNEINYLVIIISTFTADIIFTVSCFYFYNSIKHLIRIPEEKKKNILKLNIFLIVGSFNRVIYFIIRYLDPQLLLAVKYRNNDDIVDDGPYWAILCLEYFLLSDFLPMFILQLLFSPQQKVDKNTTIIAHSQVEFKKSVDSSHF